MPDSLVVHKNFLLDNLILNNFIKFFYGLLRLYYGSKKLVFFKVKIILAKQNSIPIKILNKYNEDKFMQYLINKKIDLIFIGGGWPSLISKKFLRLKMLKLLTYIFLVAKF